MGKFVDLTGQKFGRLTVLERVYRQQSKKTLWKCKCDCGNITISDSQDLRTGRAKSCGCYRKELFNDIPKERIWHPIKKCAPWMLQYFADEDKHYAEYGIYSNKRIYPVCPICGNKSDHKVMIGTIYSHRGFGCRKCGYFKRSMGERITESILTRLCVSFKPEDRVSTDSMMRYDFYLPDFNVAIEIDGSLGHGMKTFRQHDKSDIQHSVLLDKLKDKIARKNGIELIRIDAKESNFTYIYNNLLNSKLNKYLNFSVLNKEDIIRDCFYKSKYLDIINEYNNGEHNKEYLAKKYHIHLATVERYLRYGENDGICDYRKRKHNVAIKCINCDMVFQSAKEASEWCGLKSRSWIYLCCKGKAITAGKHPETGEPLRWKYA